MPLLGAPGTNDQLSVGDVQLFSWLKLMPSSNVVVVGTGLRILKMWEVRPEVPGGIGFALGRRGVRRRLQQAGMAWAGSGSPGPGPEETLAQPPAPETTSRHLSARPDQGPASDRREWLHWTMGRRRPDHPIPSHRRPSQLLLICPPPAPVFGTPGDSPPRYNSAICAARPSGLTMRRGWYVLPRLLSKWVPGLTTTKKHSLVPGEGSMQNWQRASSCRSHPALASRSVENFPRWELSQSRKVKQVAQFCCPI